jgi:hypothetical protein
MPDPVVRTMHRRAAGVPAEALWEAAETIRIRDVGTIGRIVRWRIPGTSRDQPFTELFRRYPFTVLAEGERWVVSGLCGRVWTLRRDYPHLAGAEEFRAWRDPGTVRVVFAHWIEDMGNDCSELVSESRIDAVDRGARLRLRALWRAIGHFEQLIGADALEVAVRRAEEDAEPA